MKQLILILILLSALISCSGHDYYDMLVYLSDTYPNLARSISFIDTDSDMDQISGDLKFSPALSEKNITEYRLYWGSGPATKLSGQPVVATFSANGADHFYAFPANTIVPAGAAHLLVYTANSSGEMSVPTAISKFDLVVEQFINIYPGGSSSPSGLIDIGGILYFAATEDITGAHLYRSDGTPVGTYQLLQINQLGTPGAASLDLNSWIMVSGGLIYLRATDGLNGFEIWKYDPSNPIIDYIFNPVLIDIYAGTGDSNPSKPVVLNGKLYFSATDDGTDIELFEYDPGSTYTKININGGASSSPQMITAYNNKIYCSADAGNGNGIQLVEYDPAGPTITEITIRIGASSSPANLVVYNGKLYFTADDGTNGAEIWSYDGTSAAMLKDIYAGPSASMPQGMIVYNGLLVFGANDGIHGTEPWRSDGTASGTYMILDVTIDPNSAASTTFAGTPVVYKNKFFMGFNNTTNSMELWVTDAASTGTHMLKDINANAGVDSFTSSNQSFAILNDTLYFLAADNATATDIQIWSTDGTSAGTIKRTNYGIGFNPKELYYYNGKIFFQGTSGGDSELWSLYYK